MTKDKKKPAEILVHMTRPGPGNDEDILLLGIDSERITKLQEHGFVTAGSYRLTRTAMGQRSITLPVSGIFADAFSALPWSKQ